MVRVRLPDTLTRGKCGFGLRQREDTGDLFGNGGRPDREEEVLREGVWKGTAKHSMEEIEDLKDMRIGLSDMEASN